MAWFKDNSKVIADGGKLFVGSSPLVLSGNSATFPFTIGNYSTGVNAGVYAMIFVFNTPGTITIDYGDGVVKTFNTYSYDAYTNCFYITANTAYPDLLAYHPIHNYSGGVASRTVKISYNRGLLKSFNQTQNMGYLPQPFNFEWAAHLQLETFSMSTIDYVTSINLNGLTNNTNPLLKNLSVTFFNVASEYYNHAPIQLFNLKLDYLIIGSPGYATNSTIAGTNLTELANYPIAATLKRLTISNALNDALGLPTNFTSANFPLLTDFGISGNNYTTIPAQVNQLTGLKTLRLISAISITSWGTISALTQLNTIDFQFNTTAYLLGNFPAYFNGFTGLRSFLYNGAGQHVQSVCTAIVDIVYDLITRNAPLTGANNGSVPFRGMNINLTVYNFTTAVNGTVQAPGGYTAGSSNGAPANAGEKIYVLRNQYGTTISLTT